MVTWKSHQQSLHAVSACLAQRTRRLSRLITRQYEHALRPTGLTVNQFGLMAAIALKQSISPAALARMVDLEKSSLSRNLKPLIQTRLLSAAHSDGGGQSLSITRKGRETLEMALPAWQQAQERALTMMGKDTGLKLDRMIDAMGSAS